MSLSLSPTASPSPASSSVVRVHTHSSEVLAKATSSSASSSSASSSSATAHPFAAAQRPDPQELAPCAIKSEDLVSQCDALSPNEKFLLICEINKNYQTRFKSTNPVSARLKSAIEQDVRAGDKNTQVWNKIKTYMMQPKNSHRRLYCVIAKMCEQSLLKSKKDNEILNTDVPRDVLDATKEKMAPLDALPTFEKFVILYEINTINKKHTHKESQDLAATIAHIVGANYQYNSDMGPLVEKGWLLVKGFMNHGNSLCKLYNSISDILLKRSAPESVSTWIGFGMQASSVPEHIAYTVSGIYPIGALGLLPSYIADKKSRKPISIEDLYKVVNKISTLKQSGLSLEQLSSLATQILPKQPKYNLPSLTTSRSSSQVIKNLTEWLDTAKHLPVSKQNEKASEFWGILTHYLQEKRGEEPGYNKEYLNKTSMVLRAHKNNGKKLFLTICHVINNYKVSAQQSFSL